MNIEHLFELCSVSVFPLKAQESGRVPEAIVTMVFDQGEELVWAGSAGGWINAWTVPTLERHCSVHAHPTQVVSARSMVDVGLLSVSGSQVSLHSTGGVPHFSCPDEIGYLSCCEVDYTGHQVILGRSTPKLSLLDLSRGRVLGDMDTEFGVSCMEAKGALVACGGVNGSVVLRDQRTGLRPEQTIPAHSGPVCSVGLHGDLLAVAGFTQAAQGIHYSDTVKVYDVRSGSARVVSQVSCPTGCSQLRFHPKFSSLVLLMSAAGTFTMQDVNPGARPADAHQVECEGDMVVGCSLSSTGEVLGFGDSGGFIHLWAGREDPQVNEFSAPWDVPEEPTVYNVTDCEAPLTSVPVYFGPDMPLSMLPPTQMMQVGMPPHKIDASLLKTMKQVDFVGYVANPEYKRSGVPGEATRKVAPLRNQRKGRGAAEAQFARDKLKAESLLPLDYHRVVICKPQNKRVFQEFDFKAFNHTNFAGLENGIRNCYVNALLQVLYFLPWLRSEILKHICEVEFCLTCELGFLFHMLRVGAKSTVCQASNLLRSLKQIREAAALGLLDQPNQTATSPPGGSSRNQHHLANKIQNFCRFVLEQTMKELSASTQTPTHLTAPARLFGSTVRTTNRCLSKTTPHADSFRESRSLHFSLVYPEQQVPPNQRPSFASLLQTSLCQVSHTRAWCEECHSYQPLQQVRTLCSCPEMMLINANLQHTQELFWWGVSPSVLLADKEKNSEAAGRPGSPAPSAASKAFSAPNSPIKLPNAPSDGEGRAESGEPWLPEMIGVQIHPTNGTIQVVQGADVQSVQAQMQNTNSQDRSPLSAVYEVVSMIWHIKEGALEEAEEEGMNPTQLQNKRAERDQGHLVASIKPSAVYYEQDNIKTPSKGTPGISPLQFDKRGGGGSGGSLFKSNTPASPVGGAGGAGGAGGGDPATPSTPTPPSQGGLDPSSSWLVFNDFSLSPTTSLEARSLYGVHKSPVLLFYRRVDMPLPAPLATSNISEPIFRNLSMDPVAFTMPQPTFRPLDLASEAPRAGMLLAIDCEFVSYAPAEKEVHEDGTEVEVRGAELGLARVSVVRGEGPREGLPCMDDYVRTVEPVYDYLTRFSGLQPGDLDPGISKHYLTTLKHAYLKLRYLADSGCKFIGHGLKKDFRMANIVIPPENVIDTVEIFHFKRQRLLSLRYLASYLLGLDIQQRTHDSIEDAVVALRVYKKYLELEARGVFQETLLEMYRYGKNNGWEVVNGGPVV